MSSATESAEQHPAATAPQATTHQPSAPRAEEASADDPHASIYDHGFVRVAAVTLPVALADPATNAERHLEQLRGLHEQQVGLAVFPELSLTGYSLDDLVLQEPLLDAAEAAIGTLVAASRELLPVIVVGAPVRWRHRVYNAAVVIHRGRILSVVPKANLPTYREFYERRWFAPGDDVVGERITLRGAGEQGADVPFGTRQLVEVADLPGLVLHVEICEDMWVPVPPSAEAALAGATVLVNLSGSPITVGRAEERKLLARSAADRCQAAYVYAAAGEGESTTDLAWDGQTFVYECGTLLGESERFPQGPRATVVDVDLDRIVAERRRQSTFDDNRRAVGTADRFTTHRALLRVGEGVWGDARPGAYTDTGVSFGTFSSPEEIAAPGPGPTGPLRRPLHRFPFVPDDAARLAQDSYEAFSIQVAGLVRRLSAIGGDRPGGARPVIGVSGGLDSTHALIVCARAMDLLGRDRSEILAYTMPGFATSEHTRSNAELLSTAIGASFETVDIRPAATQMLADMDHPFGRGEEIYDVTFENVQAGLRYDYLFRLANHHGGIVVGTGDLSELALGWCTYGVGDQMSHYGVNAGVPKTLIQHLIRWVIAEGIFDESTSAVLRAVLDTEISPELIPTKPGEKAQSTEDSIGPYALHDFTLYHVLRRGYGPAKIAYLAHQTWGDLDAGEWPPGYAAADQRAYSRAEIKHWLTVFTRRFFSNQFKRSALPNAPKVLAGGSLSPRGDWRMPSDATSRAWLAQIEREVPGD
ncbi:NAD(+) synthase [Brachybacterium sp. YJGR34]|uniref:NAD(+) synthase n=1 Tax=Brachybacterium sp. YJGR34 TaxID=2059911 RepID=UPI000E0AF2BB|nr:NAD(+) synthase [Brachybacterium sp. YJGR34]